MECVAQKARNVPAATREGRSLLLHLVEIAHAAEAALDVRRGLVLLDRRACRGRRRSAFALLVGFFTHTAELEVGVSQRAERPLVCTMSF